MCVVAARAYKPYPRVLSKSPGRSYGQARSLRIRSVGEEALFVHSASNRSSLEAHRSASAQAFAEVVAGGPWRHMESIATDNLCIEGRLLPKLFLLGAAKSATTSMAANLMGAGVEVSGPDCRGWCNSYEPHFAHQKELHYFDYKMSWTMSTLGDYESNRHEWVGLFPECEKPAGAGARLLSKFFPRKFPQRKRIMADFTPEYLRMVPLPEGSRYDENSMVHHMFPESSEDVKAKLNLPSILRLFYGEAATTVNFVLMVRSPLERMQSLYYCCLCPPDDEDPDPSCLQSNFENDLRNDLAKLTESPPTFSDWVWGSFYGRHIERWLEHFGASQFYTIPFREFTESDGSSICIELSSRLAYEMDCLGTGKQSTWLEHEHPHPPLSEDVSESTRKEYDELMAKETWRLANVLARVHQNGGGLAGYDPGTNNRAGSDTVYKWLMDRW